MLGAIAAFRSLGWEVRPYIVGDQVPRLAERQGARMSLQRSLTRQLAADAVRIAMRYAIGSVALRHVGTSVDFVYERFAAMQAMGRSFQRRGVPWVLETNGPFYYEAKVERASMILSGVARRFEVAAYRQCDVLICVSEALKRIVVEVARIDPSKVIVVPNGVDPDRFAPGRARPRRVSDELTIGFAGSVRSWQGLDLLLRAMARVRRQGVPVAALIVGDGPDRGALESLARDLALERVVHFVGHVPWEEVPGHLAGCDLGYSGQRTMQLGAMYHSPLKLYEYMAMGLPVVASSFDDAVSLLSSGGRGYLFEPGSADDLADKLRQAFEVRDQLPTWGRQSRQAIFQHHTWETRVRRMIEQIAEVLTVSAAAAGGATRPWP